MGQMEMKCIFNIGKKKISTLAKATQVSDVAHGPLVRLLIHLSGAIFVFVFLVNVFNKEINYMINNC
jgi:hypothetical protein